MPSFKCLLYLEWPKKISDIIAEKLCIFSKLKYLLNRHQIFMGLWTIRFNFSSGTLTFSWTEAVKVEIRENVSFSILKVRCRQSICLAKLFS